MVINNEHPITGTLYSKITRTATGKKAKNLGKIYEFYYYILEVPTRKTWTVEGKERSIEKKELIKFSLPQGVNPDDFAVGDHLKLAFTITGNEWVNRDGVKDVINENKILRIGFDDIQNGASDSRHNPGREKVFVPQSMNTESNIDDDNLPF